MKTKTLLILGSLFVFPIAAHSQVGINTPNPQGILHIDGAKDNPDTGAPDAVQQSNDFTVRSTGNVGLGTIAPVARLHLYNHTAGNAAGNDYLFDDESAVIPTDAAGLMLRRSNAGANLAQNDLIGGILFNPKINGAFGYTGAGIAGIYRGNGTDAKTALAFRINANQEAARIDENGNIGIGTTTPKQQLHIVGSGATSGITSSFVSGSAFTGSGPAAGLSGPGFYMENTSAPAGSRLLKINYTQNAIEPFLNFQRVTDDASGDAGNILSLTRSGKLGIGTTTPNEKLNVTGSIAFTGQAAVNKTSYGSLDYATLFGTPMTRMLSWGPNASTNGIISFWTGVGGAVTTEKMRIHSNGSVGIGTAAPTSLLSVNGTADKPGGGSWGTFSDRRVKKDIADFNDGLNVITQLKPVTYKYNEKSGYKDLTKEYVGFIAQDIEKVAPYMVSIIDDTKKSGLSDKRELDDSALTKILVNAIKEQQKIIETQGSQIEAIQNELNSLKNQK